MGQRNQSERKLISQKIQDNTSIKVAFPWTDINQVINIKDTMLTASGYNLEYDFSAV